MTREQLADRLARMIETVESGTLPARVREFYLFEPRRRGAVLHNEPRVVVVHDEPQKETTALERRVDESGNFPLHPILRAMLPFDAKMRRALSPEGESLQIMLARRLYDIMGQIGTIKRGELTLLWSETDTDYLPKLEAVRSGPPGGDPRHHIVALTRLNDSIATMERAVDMVRQEQLLLTRVPLDRINCRLNAYHAHWLSCWTECRIIEAHLLRLVPYGMWWLEQHRQTAEVPHQFELWSKSRSHRVDAGRPSLARMIACFKQFPDLKRQCLILHPRAGEANELLIFERGKNWVRAESPAG